MNSRNCSNLEARKLQCAIYLLFPWKNTVVWVYAQSEHTRLQLLAETFDTTLRTAGPALTFSGDFYTPAPILCSLFSDKYIVFLFHFSLILSLSFKNCPLFCVLILHCIVDAVFVFLQYFRRYIFQGAWKEKYFQTNSTFWKEYISAWCVWHNAWRSFPCRSEGHKTRDVSAVSLGKMMS